MVNYSKDEVVLVDYPFSDFSSSKVRPAVVVNSTSPSRDCFIVPISTHISGLIPGEFALSDWVGAGLKMPSAVKRGITTVVRTRITKKLGRLTAIDARQLDAALRGWLGL